MCCFCFGEERGGKLWDFIKEVGEKERGNVVVVVGECAVNAGFD